MCAFCSHNGVGRQWTRPCLSHPRHFGQPKKDCMVLAAVATWGEPWVNRQMGGGFVREMLRILKEAEEGGVPVI